MAALDPKFEAEQDAELQSVPVPAGLSDRLRRVVWADDAGLDAALREVAPPRGLIQRLRLVVVADDDEALDAAIRDVAVPADLPRSVLQYLFEEDKRLDEAIRNVRIPVDFHGRLRRVPKYRIRAVRLVQWVTAASLLIGIGLSYVGGAAALLISAFPPEDHSGPRLQTWTAQWAQPSQPDFTVVWSPGEGPSPETPVLLPEGPSIPKLARFDDRPSQSFDPTDRLMAPYADPMERTGLWPSDGRLLATHTANDEQEDLQLVAGHAPRGFHMPAVPGAHLDFLLKYGVHPFVSPGADPQLCISQVPLAADTARYELTRRHLEEGVLPRPEDVRTEDFLAAGEYGFPCPKGQTIELSTFAGPSPFGGPGARLLQIGVQARRFEDRPRDPVTLVLAVDVSSSMRRGGRLASVRRAIGKVASRMRPGDRVSLVAFSEDARLLAEDIDAENRAYLVAAAAALAVRGSTNVGAGLRQAYAVAPPGDIAGSSRTHVVLLTDGLVELPFNTVDLIRQRTAAAHARGIRLDVVSLGEAGEVDPQLDSFAESGGGKVYRGANAEEVGWALQEIISGVSQSAATDVELKVTFNPERVLEYRLLGHEAGPITASMKADFHVDASATALYELRLKPGSDGNEVATAELQWRTPGSDTPDGDTPGSDTPGNGKVRKRTRRVTANQFVEKFVDAAPSLQEAALLAYTAESLRQSPFAPDSRNPRSLAVVLEWAQKVDSRLYRQPAFADFLAVVQQASEAKPYRRGGG